MRTKTTVPKCTPTRNYRRMSDVPVQESSRVQRRSPSNPRSTSRTALYKQRMKLYRRHAKLYPHDTAFKNLQMPASLRTVYKSPQRRRPAKSTKTRRISNYFNITSNHATQVGNEHRENVLDDACSINLTCSGSHDNAPSVLMDTENFDRNGISTMEIESNSQNNKGNALDTGTTGYIDSGMQLQENSEVASVVMPQVIIDEDPLFDADISYDCNGTGYSEFDEENSVVNGIDDENNTSEEDSKITSCGEELDEMVNDTDNDGDNCFSIGKSQEWSQRIQLKNWVSKIHVIATIIAISLRGKLTYEITSIILMNLNTMFINNGIPSSMKSLWSMLSRNDENASTRRLYCRTCKDYVGKGNTPNRDCTCKECGPDKNNNSLSYFIQVKIVPQLRQLLSDPTAVSSLWYRFSRKKKNANAVEDIYDGTKYKEKCEAGGFLSNENNFSFSLFVDGCQVSKSSKASAWPILIQINEFSPYARKRYIMLAGVWVDTVHPDLNMLLLPTVKELHDLYHEGFTWRHPINETVVTSKFVTLVCIADTVARPAILNMTMFNGKYGCTFCYAEGTNLPGRGVNRIYPIDNSVSRRTDSGIRKCMQKAKKTGKKRYGVKGLAAVAILPEFDLSLGPVVESMHNVYLGVVKLHTLLLLHGNADDVWYAGSPAKISCINSRLINIRTPSKISRRPRPIEDINRWKASEWRNWSQYYALPCLEGIIRKCDLEHLALISRATYILNQDSIDTDEMQEARLLIKEYVRIWENTFGIHNMKYNIHLLSHLVDTVQNWGPFFAHSAFPFESWNMKIIDKVTSATSRPLQIVTRFLMTRFIERCLIDPDITDKTKKAIRSILTSGLKKRDISINLMPGSSKFRGIGNSYNRPPHRWEFAALRSAGYLPETVCFYEHAIINGIDYRSREKDKKKTTRFCNKVMYCPKIEYGEIIEIVSFYDHDEIIHGFLVERVCTLGPAFGARNIQNAELSLHKAFVSTDDLPVPAILIKTPNECRITRLPNVWETD